MAHRVSSANWSARASLRTSGIGFLQGPEAAWHDLCVQCGFPWGLHPERYDHEDKVFARVCSEFPAAAPWAVQSWIRP